MHDAWAEEGLKVPAEHAAQDVEAVEAWYRPVAQASHPSVCPEDAWKRAAAHGGQHNETEHGCSSP